MIVGWCQLLTDPLTTLVILGDVICERSLSQKTQELTIDLQWYCFFYQMTSIRSTKVHRAWNRSMFLKINISNNQSRSNLSIFILCWWQTDICIVGWLMLTCCLGELLVFYNETGLLLYHIRRKVIPKLERILSGTTFKLECLLCWEVVYYTKLIVLTVKWAILAIQVDIFLSRFPEHKNRSKGPVKKHFALCTKSKLRLEDMELLVSTIRSDTHLLGLEALFIRDVLNMQNYKRR